MKILIVNTYDSSGGAARAAYRLHRVLLSENMKAEMLVMSKTDDDYTVSGPGNKLQKAFAMASPYIDAFPLKFYPSRNKTLFSPAWFPSVSIVDQINSFGPDIVHLHWICNGMIRIEDLVKIKAPIVWSLHDMWAFTGGCHYDGGCEKYVNNCGSCPVLGSEKEVDLSRKVWNRKARVYDSADFTIVGLSRWLAACAQKSHLLKNKKIVNLPNPIDTSVFAPVEKTLARRLLNLSQSSKIILFGAMGATSDPRKGFKELSEALRLLSSKNIELAIFGSSQPESGPDFGFPTHYLGSFHDDLALKILYSAADVMVVPSLQENLSNAIVESLACGTPVVAFDIGGNSDMIDHQKNGYLAEALNQADLCRGIEWVLSSPNYSELCINSREKILREFESKLIALKYIELYKEVLAVHS